MSQTGHKLTSNYPAQCAAPWTFWRGVAGALSENLAVIVICGGPNSNDFGTNRILHHTVGLPDFHQEYKCFQQVTCDQVRLIARGPGPHGVHP